MRIDELKKIAEENGYGYTKSFGEHNLLCKDNLNRITINEDYPNMIFISNTICRENDMNMIKASIEFAETPPEDREEEKKFYLRHRWILNKEFSLYLQKRHGIVGDEMRLAFFDFSGNNDKKFTLKEVEEIKKKFDTDLKDFELVEVE